MREYLPLAIFVILLVITMGTVIYHQPTRQSEGWREFALESIEACTTVLREDWSPDSELPDACSDAAAVRSTAPSWLDRRWYWKRLEEAVKALSRAGQVTITTAERPDFERAQGLTSLCVDEIERGPASRDRSYCSHAVRFINNLPEGSAVRYRSAEQHNDRSKAAKSRAQQRQADEAISKGQDRIEHVLQSEQSREFSESWHNQVPDHLEGCARAAESAESGRYGRLDIRAVGECAAALEFANHAPTPAEREAFLQGLQNHLESVREIRQQRFESDALTWYERAPEHLQACKQAVEWGEDFETSYACRMARQFAEEAPTVLDHLGFGGALLEVGDGAKSD